MPMPEIFILEHLSIWTTILASTFLYFRRCSTLLENVIRLIKLLHHRKERQSRARIGVSGYVRIPVMVGVSTVYVANAENATELETTRRALLLSKLAMEKELA